MPCRSKHVDRFLPLPQAGAGLLAMYLPQLTFGSMWRCLQDQQSGTLAFQFVATTVVTFVAPGLAVCQNVQAWIHEAFVRKGVLFGRVFLCATLTKLWKAL